MLTPDPADSPTAQRPARQRRPGPTSGVAPQRATPDVILVGSAAPFVRALAALQEAGALNVRAVVEPADGARASLQQQFPNASCTRTFDPVVAPPDSLAIITTPARFHAAQAGTAMKRGWHVLCSMPFATTAREGTTMIAAAKRHERFLAVDLPHRFFPATRYLRTLCIDHLLGAPVDFRIHEGAPRPVPPDAAPSSDKFESPDGVLHDLGPAVFDLLTWYLENVTIKHYADDAMGGVEANASIEVAFGEGFTGLIQLSRDWETEQSHTFVFERGVVRWDATHPGRLTLQIASAPGALRGELVTQLVARQPHPTMPLLDEMAEATVAQVAHVLAAIAGREKLRIAASDVMPALNLIDACYARRTPLAQPWLPKSEAIQARALAPPAALRRP